jgi:hypothetical protein
LYIFLYSTFNNLTYIFILLFIDCHLPPEYRFHKGMGFCLSLAHWLLT